MTRTPERIATELLVLKAQSGDRAAFDGLVRIWGPILLRRCLRQLDQPADAQDAAQRVWVKAMRGIGRLKDPACFAAWLLRIGHLTCIDFIRRRRRTHVLHDELHQATQDDDDQTANQISPAAMDLRAAIKSLSASQQEVLELHYTGGFSMGEVAHILGLAEGTVKSRLHTARQILRTKLETGENNDTT
ncbi:MAG: hypothetical protein COA47_06735 [Robiginitomaculum sp.]|nr:MAG: hypothetical protein COA47_06735 [Robiginitomaculum sp.]